MHDKPLLVIGNHISPFVRKVLAVCEIKQLPYRVDSIVPFFGNEAFAELSPLRRIPVLIDGDVVVNDSSVICEYLEDKWPAVPVLGTGPLTRAHARFLDEYADTRITDVVLWKVFGRALVAPAVFKAPRDLAAIEKTMREDFPAMMGELERWAPAEGFATGASCGLADVSVASHFANLRWARQTLDAARWPKAAAWIARVEDSAPMRGLNAIGEKILRTPPEAHDEVLRGLGVAIAAESVRGTVAQRGPMTAI